MKKLIGGTCLALGTLLFSCQDDLEELENETIQLNIDQRSTTRGDVDVDAEVTANEAQAPQSDEAVEEDEKRKRLREWWSKWWEEREGRYDDDDRDDDEDDEDDDDDEDDEDDDDE